MDKIKSTLRKLYKIVKVTLLSAFVIGFVINLFIAEPEEKKTAQKKTSQPVAKIEKGEIKKDAFYLPKAYERLRSIQRQGYEQLLTQGKCPILHYADISSSKGTPQDPVLYYTCEKSGKESNIFLKVSDIKAGTAQVQEPPQERWAMNECEKFLKKKLNHPSTLRSTSFKTRTWNNGRRAIYMTGKAKNSFGLEVGIVGNCLFIPKDGQFTIEGFVKEEK